MYKISSFKSIEKKHDVYRFKDSIKTFCESLREHTMKIINFKKNEIINKRAAELMKKCKSLIYFSKKKKKKKKMEKEYAKDKKYCKAEDHCRYTREYSGAAHSIKKCT